jgi:tight adherence protein B
MEPLLQIVASGKAFAFTVFPMIGSILLAYGIYQVVIETRHGQHKRLIDRLRGVEARSKQKSGDSILRRSAADDDDGFFSQIVAKMAITPRVQTLLDQACVPWSASKMLVNQSAIAFALFFGAMILKYHVLVGAVAGASALFLPLAWLNWSRARRMKRLTAQLPDVFEIMSQALRAGHSLASSLEVVHEQLPDPAGSEFGRVFHEQNLGIKIEDALTSMASRVDSLDVRFFVTAVLIQRQTGGDLAEVLDKISSVIRQRIELFGLVQGLTAEGRLSGWVLLALPLVVFAAVALLNPGYSEQLTGNATGKMLLMVAGGMQLMGLAMIRWIVNIKV